MISEIEIVIGYEHIEERNLLLRLRKFVIERFDLGIRDSVRHHQVVGDKVFSWSLLIGRDAMDLVARLSWGAVASCGVVGSPFGYRGRTRIPLHRLPAGGRSCCFRFAARSPTVTTLPPGGPDEDE